MKFITLYVQSDLIKIQFTVLSFSIPAVQFGSQSWYFAVWLDFENGLWALTNLLPEIPASSSLRMKDHPLPNSLADVAQLKVQFSSLLHTVVTDLRRLPWPWARPALNLFVAVGEEEVVLLTGILSSAAPSLHELTLYRGNRWQEKFLMQPYDSNMCREKM